MSKSARQSASEVLRVQKVVKTPSPSISCVASDSSVPDDMEPADGASIEGVVVATEEIFQDSQSSDGEGQTAGASDNIQQDDSADLSSKNGQSCSFGATSSSSSNSNGISESAGSNVKSEDFRCSNANQASSSGSSKGVIANGNGTSSSSGARSKVGLHSGSSSSSSGSKARKQNDHAELLVALTEQVQFQLLWLDRKKTHNLTLSNLILCFFRFSSSKRKLRRSRLPVTWRTCMLICRAGEE